MPNRRRLADVPRTVWLVTALWGSLLIGASLVWPMTYGYDEPQHIDMAYVYSASPFHFYGPGELLPTKANIGMQSLQPGYPPRRPFGATPTPPRGERPSFAELGGHQPSQHSQPNQMVQHPPLYYWTAAVVLRLPGVSHLAWDLQVWLMRLLSVLYLLPVPALCWATARRLLAAEDDPDRGTHLAVLAAVVPLTVPNLIRDGSSVTNDSLLILATSVLLYLLSRVLTGDLSRRTATWVAASLAVALLTKGFALVLPPVVLAAYLARAYQLRARRPADGTSPVRAVATPLGIAAAGGVVGGLWWLRNLIEFHAVQPDGFGPGYQEVLFGPPDNRGALRPFVSGFTRAFAKRLWGGIGLADDPSPGPVIVYGWLVAVLLGLIAAFVVRACRGDRARFAVLLSSIVVTTGLVAAGSYHDFRRWSDAIRGAQGRYLYHLIVVVAAVAAIGWVRAVPPRGRRVLVPAVLLAAVATNAVAWLMLLRSWYAPGSGLGLRALLDRAPVPAAVTVALVAVLPAALTVLAMTGVIRDGMRPAPPMADEPDLATTPALPSS
jgi:4-amino-4-deoxy-L-arabinose transferase-like glycosyltransferase